MPCMPCPCWLASTSRPHSLALCCGHLPPSSPLPTHTTFAWPKLLPRHLPCLPCTPPSPQPTRPLPPMPGPHVPPCPSPHCPGRAARTSPRRGRWEVEPLPLCCSVRGPVRGGQESGVPEAAGAVSSCACEPAAWVWMQAATLCCSGLHASAATQRRVAASKPTTTCQAACAWGACRSLGHLGLSNAVQGKRQSASPLGAGACA